MTVADMTAFDIYALIITALAIGVWAPVFIYRAYSETTWKVRQKVFFWIAGAALWAAPVFYTFRYILLG